MTAKTYAESMPSNCYPSGSALYAPRHIPWTYFSSGVTRCKSNDLPLVPFQADARNNNLPNAGSLTLSDDFLKAQLPAVLGSTDFTSGKLTVVVTADEGTDAANSVLTVVLNAALSGKVVTTPLNHYSLTRYYGQVSGTAPLLKGAAAPDMRLAFGL